MFQVNGSTAIWLLCGSSLGVLVLNLTPTSLLLFVALSDEKCAFDKSVALLLALSLSMTS